MHDPACLKTRRLSGIYTNFGVGLMSVEDTACMQEGSQGMLRDVKIPKPATMYTFLKAATLTFTMPTLCTTGEQACLSQKVSVVKLESHSGDAKLCSSLQALKQTTQDCGVIHCVAECATMLPEFSPCQIKVHKISACERSIWPLRIDNSTSRSCIWLPAPAARASCSPEVETS